MSKPTVPSDGEKYAPAFWRKSQYSSFEEAKKSGGLYCGADSYGYATFAEAMRCASAVADCLAGNSQNDDVMVHIVVDDKTVVEIPLGQTHLG